MSVTVRITVEDVNERLDDGQTVIELERAASVSGSYTNVTNITLVENTYYYDYLDTNGTLTSWFRYRFGVTPQSDYSNPFQVEGASRQRIRQRALDDYGCGHLITASAGTTSQVTTIDYRVRSTFHQLGRGAGTWLLPVNGANLGITRTVSALDPTTGVFTVETPWTASIAANDIIEWHHIASPEEWNLAINRALDRYSYLERVPINGNNSHEMSLAFLPWLRTKRQVAGIWWRPTGATVDTPWGTRGRWWDLRQDQDGLTLITNAALDPTITIYVEAYRRFDPLYTDESVAPAACQVELAACLAYDEILAQLVRPRIGSTNETRAIWSTNRAMLQQRLRGLQLRNAPQARVQRPQLPEPTSVPYLYSAR